MGDGYVPQNYYQKWMRLFVHGQKIDSNYDLPVHEDKVQIPLLQIQSAGDIRDEEAKLSSVPSSETKAVTMADLVDKSNIVFQGIKLLDDQEFDDYFHLKGGWVNGA